jgi:hypothetical protein
MSVDINKSGPLFDGRAADETRRFEEESQELVAQESLKEVHRRLGQVLKHPTGYYQSRVVADRSASTTAVTDGNVVYGPWLEGTSSRNQSTKFKGYQTFRKVRQDIEQRVTDIVKPALDKLTGRLNG